MDICVLCKEAIGLKPSSTLTEKGCVGIVSAGISRGETIHVAPGQTVHHSCRRDYCNKYSIEAAKKRQDESQVPGPSSASRSRRSQTSEFLFAEHCLFCGQTAKVSSRKRGYDVFPVRTKDFQTSIEKACRQRLDSWGEAVRGRLEFAQDFHAADAVYHNVCNINFRTGKQIPAAFQMNPTEGPKVGRPEDLLKSAAFEKVAQYLIENDDEQLTLSDLQTKMAEFSEGVLYDIKYLKQKLKTRFGDKIVITAVNKKPNVVTFKSTAASILQSFYAEPHLDDGEAEKMRIITTAAYLLRNDILDMEASKDFYPGADDIASDDENKKAVPESLWAFLRLIFSEKNASKKLASIGQAIVQAARPRLILSPLQLGLAVQMHQHFGSRFLIDTLSSLGFCSSYSEVQRFEASAAVTCGTDIKNLAEESFVNYIADNVDHNLRTIDGHNTFHAMGMIATVTPAVRSKPAIPRLTSVSGDLKAAAWVEVCYFKRHLKELPALTYTELPGFQCQDSTTNFDLLWRLSWPTRSPRPGWSGTMQAVHKGQYPGISSSVFLPMIDMDPTDMSCVYSTLKFISKEARRHDIKAVLTFDQPLWWKAQVIVSHNQDDDDFKILILRLGVFHVEMSFLGCIGHIMEGSGLREVLECIYAGNAVCHMLNGKAVARAVRGHELVVTALYALLADKDDNNQSTSNTEAEGEGVPGLKQALSLYDKVVSCEISLEDLSSDAVNDLKVWLSDKRKLASSNRTAALWYQYTDMEQLLKDLIKAERTGNWALHLKTLHDMLPYFAASGHNLYAKSIYLYLQQMSQLQEIHPDVLQKFKDGYHVVRRSDRYWGGLSTDLFIEQVLMRSVKTTGGLTRGRGLTESQRAQWLLSMPASAYVNQAMQIFTDTVYATNEQHKEATAARQMRDFEDVKRLIIFLKDHNPFDEGASLRSIVTGMTFDARVTADTAKDVGLKILKEMPGNLAESFVFRRKSQIVNMNETSSLRIDGDSFQIDPQILFQRFVASANRITENSAEIFQFELSTHPSSLFEPSGHLRIANKASLADCLWKLTDGKDSVARDLNCAHYVLDGGSLLHKIPWARGHTFEEICDVYVKHVKGKYPSSTVVFDGYPDWPTTKDMAHMRRNKGMAGPRISFSPHMLCLTKKEQILAHKENKQDFINLLSSKLNKAGCLVRHATDDADRLISQTAIESAQTRETVVVAQDTDILVLLLNMYPAAYKPLYLLAEGRQDTSNSRTWSINQCKAKIGTQLCQLLPFIHAMTGCDTTSRMFGIGKAAALKRLREDKSLQEIGELFSESSMEKEKVANLGQAAILNLYGAKNIDNLDDLRYHRFVEKACSGVSTVSVQTLPPTASAAAYHSLRAYLQIQQWLGSAALDPEQWGWVVTNNMYKPVTTDKPIAPQTLLKVIRCNCKSECDTRRCTCRKHGLDCSSACGECRGTSCTNAPSVDLSD